MLLPELVRQAARRTPEATAIEWEGSRLSYAELDAWADAYAADLQRRRVMRGSVVAVSLSRTPRLVAALLGILRAGAAYLPVDPALPESRRQFLLEDAGAALRLDDASPVPDRSRAPVFAAPATGPDDLAYVIYTSGSTGRPKGVEIPHAALANFLEGMQEAPGLRPADRVLAHTTISFDIHVLEIWLPLVTGATIVLAGRGAAGDPAALVRLAAHARTTVVQATPALWWMLLRAGWDGKGVKALCGGEALRRDLADALLATCAELWNMYGPTETTVWSTAWRVRPDGPILIGRPIRNTTIRILPTDAGAPLEEGPPGEPGELCIGGDGLARGYRGRPDLTSARFIEIAGGRERLYRTGDLARRLEDGSLEHLGRIDDQLKIAGHRIEPGEIETALRGVPGVREAAVVGVDEGRPAHRLVAYVAAEPPIAPAVLRDALARSLPAYLVPSQFVSVDALPLTPSGKVDRRALPSPALLAASPGVPPANATEAALLDLFREVLEAPEAGVTDDFFDLGGHSRLAAFLLSRVARRFGCTLPIPTLVEAPTVRDLAGLVDQAIAAGPRRSARVLPLTAAGSDRPTLFLVHAAGGHALIYGALGRALARDATIEVIQARGFDGVDDGTGGEDRRPGRTTVDRLADSYLEDIRARQPAGPYALGGASFGGIVAYEIARRLRAAGEAVPVLLLFDSELPRIGLSPAVRALARVPGFRDGIYPRLRRAHAHASTLVRGGLRAYAGWLRRGGMRGLVTPAWRHDVPGGEALLDGLARVRVANERALADYIPRGYDGPLLYCRAREVTPSAEDTRGRWTEICAGTVYRDVPGTHHTMLLPPHVEALAVIVREALEDLARSSASAATRLRPRPLPPTPQPASQPHPTA